MATKQAIIMMTRSTDLKLSVIQPLGFSPLLGGSSATLRNKANKRIPTPPTLNTKNSSISFWEVFSANITSDVTTHNKKRMPVHVVEWVGLGS